MTAAMTSNDKNSNKAFRFKAALLLSLSYLLYGMLRKTVPVTTSLLIHDIGFSKADIGLISASFGLGFGISKLLGGYVCDIYSCKIILALGLLTAAVSCLIFIFIPPIYDIYFRGIWLLHGFGQGVGWPAIASLIYDNFDIIGRSSVWSIISSVS